jgi:hypothetical protein
MVHRSFRHSKAASSSLDDLAAHVAQKFIDGAKVASQAFAKAGVRHVLVGGLAVGLHGYPRNTRDIDFLVDDTAFDTHGLIVTPKAGLPIQYAGIDIDWVSLEPDERAALDPFMVLPTADEVPIIPIEPLVFMKLLAGRAKDHADVVEMIKAGADVDPLRTFVLRFKPDLEPTLDRLAAIAAREA